MIGREGTPQIAFWLIPEERARRFLVSTIKELAIRFDAPLFEPHLTIYVSPKGNREPSEVLNQALARYGSLRLSIVKLQYSDIFTKSLFIQFASSPLIIALNRSLQAASLDRDCYDLDPHLSLIYKNMTPRDKIEVINSLSIPFTEVLFDRVQAMICPVPTETRQDVESWRVAGRQRLLS